MYVCMHTHNDLMVHISYMDVHILYTLPAQYIYM